MNIIGLGKAGCDLALELVNHGPYKLFLLDEKKYRRKSMQIGPFETPEEYESNFPDLAPFFTKLKGQTCVVFSGADFVTSSVLRLLQLLEQQCIGDLKVLYIQPSQTSLNNMQKTHDRMVMGVIQQYARSALLTRMYVVSAEAVERIVGQTTVMDYHKSLNKIIAYAYHMVNYFNNNKSVISTIGPPPETSRISSFGFLDMEKNEEKMLFPLAIPRQISYYYGVSNKKLMDDFEFHSEIKNFIKSQQPPDISVGYAIYDFGEAEDFCLIVKDSTLIQNQEI